MLDGERLNAELFAEWSEYIKDDQVRSAFWYLIGIAACQRKFNCEIRWKGKIRDFRFLDSGGEQPFSFITNQESLLFYFRSPAIRSSLYSIREVSTAFETFEENPAGEWTVKIRDIEDVDQLVRYLGWTR